MSAPEFPMPKTPGGLDLTLASDVRGLLARSTAAEIDECNVEFEHSEFGECVTVEDLRMFFFELFEIAPRLSNRQWQKVKDAVSRVLM